MKHSLFFFLLGVFFTGCAKVEPRKPINPKPSTTVLQATKKAYASIKEREENKIKRLIQLDSSRNYNESQYGFWYTYLVQQKSDKPRPKTGDTVAFMYEISDLEGNLIYSKEALGLKKYVVDKEEFITAIQNGIKLMKEGATITFVIPFYNAFGVSGDFNKIGVNTSIKSTVTLIKIN